MNLVYLGIIMHVLCGYAVLDLCNTWHRKQIVSPCAYGPWLLTINYILG